MKNIIEKAQIIAHKGEEKDFTEAQEILMDYLKDNLQDTQVWLLLTRIECNSPFDDCYRIIHYAQHILSYDPSNPYALLFWSYADYYLMGNSDDNFYNNLSKAYSDNLEVMSMIEVAKARYFKFRDKKKYEKHLEKSIEYWPENAESLYLLGDFYIKQGKIEKGKVLEGKGFEYADKAKTNEPSYDFDPANLEKFFKHYFANV